MFRLDFYLNVMNFLSPRLLWWIMVRLDRYLIVMNYVSPRLLFNRYKSCPSSSSSSISSPRGSLGHHRWFCNQFSSFFPVLHCPLGLVELQACPFLDVVFPPFPLSALSSHLFLCLPCLPTSSSLCLVFPPLPLFALSCSPFHSESGFTKTVIWNLTTCILPGFDLRRWPGGS